MESKDFQFSMKLHMRWSDMDEMHHVNNAVYLTYLEDARGFYLDRACQWDWEKDGIILANANINYLKPLHFLDDATLYVRCSKLGNKSFNLEYLIQRVKNEVVEVVANASTVQVMFNYSTASSVAIPADIKRKISAFEGLDHHSAD